MMQRTSVLCLASALALAAIAPVGAAEAPQAVPVENGGFEVWQALDANAARQEGAKSVRLLPAGQAPAGWTPMREAYPQQGPTVTIALDERVKHGGARAVRIENRDPRDIAYVLYSTERFIARPGDPRNIRPNRRYAVRWWVKGADVAPGGTGPILMMSVFSRRDGKTYRTPAAEAPPHPQGTFDWEPRQLVFITDPYARWVGLTFQLRWTTGTIWYDDVELVDLGPVVHVQTY
jgi:hypothetical protein